MGVRAVIKAFLVASIVAVGGLTAYHHYVEGRTPSSALFEALEAYTSVADDVVTAALNACADYLDTRF